MIRGWTRNYLYLCIPWWLWFSNKKTLQTIFFYEITARVTTCNCIKTTIASLNSSSSCHLSQFLLKLTNICHIVTDSPYSDRTDRKESIKKLMKELSKDAEIKRSQPAKESIASSDSEKQKTTAEKTKHSALRLFRTVSWEDIEL